ncbi:hypothetical protein TcasGA2_TC006880 [Tribolium castaneum]|uniref:Uncharacterized protein n=1 Tax=Tribolium castaneum TaxID=7070 RepID=D7EIN1_TRICA|nr:hypothetical protein TcasGA2_TC006880 [Tribolium castaneum]
MYDGGDRTSTLGIVKVKIELGNFKTEIDAIVVEKLPKPVILRTKFLHKFRACVNFDDGSIKLRNGFDNVTLHFDTKEHEFSKSFVAKQVKGLKHSVSKMTRTTVNANITLFADDAKRNTITNHGLGNGFDLVKRNGTQLCKKGNFSTKKYETKRNINLSKTISQLRELSGLRNKPKSLLKETKKFSRVQLDEKMLTTFESFIGTKQLHLESGSDYKRRKRTDKSVKREENWSTGVKKKTNSI